MIFVGADRGANINGVILDARQSPHFPLKLSWLRCEKVVTIGPAYILMHPETLVAKSFRRILFKDLECFKELLITKTMFLRFILWNQSLTVA